jgi:hypothetical protein
MDFLFEEVVEAVPPPWTLERRDPKIHQSFLLPPPEFPQQLPGERPTLFGEAVCGADEANESVIHVLARGASKVLVPPLDRKEIDRSIPASEPATDNRGE